MSEWSNVEPSEREPRKARVLVVDRHPIERHGLWHLVNAQQDLEVCGEADTAAEAMAAVERATPDLVVMDLTLGQADGFALIRSLRELSPALPILVVSGRGDLLFAERALRAGARGYVTRDDAVEAILETIRQLLKGAVYVAPSVSAQMVQRLAGGEGENGRSAFHTLTDRELQVLNLLGQGRTTREVAGVLGVSVKTVDSHRHHIKKKLNLRTGSELVRYAVQWVEMHLLA